MSDQDIKIGGKKWCGCEPDEKCDCDKESEDRKTKTSNDKRVTWNPYDCPRCGLHMAHHYGRGYVCERCDGIE